jgi:hypothetical protein
LLHVQTSVRDGKIFDVATFPRRTHRDWAAVNHDVLLQHERASFFVGERAHRDLAFVDPRAPSSTSRSPFAAVVRCEGKPVQAIVLALA